ncbi:MAG: phosphatidylserine/phosphatidylglycerophosphate related protein [Phycisphaerales bacterium]|nr:phosphatidylserine/phosphatidylglycerophosphate related protein [Phycisphaerales bacterium]
MNRFPAILLLTLLGGCVPAIPPAKSHRTFKPPAVTHDDISVYFSPDGGALAAILFEIDHARASVDLQAYLITSMELVDSLKSAHARGVRVRIILDKHNIGGIYSAHAYLADSGLAVWRDGRHKDAHDKIILVDGQTLITGSFNFTDQSEDQNAENLLIIRNKPELYAAYLRNFETHLRHSDPPG